MKEPLPWLYTENDDESLDLLSKQTLGPRNPGDVAFLEEQPAYANALWLVGG